MPPPMRPEKRFLDRCVSDRDPRAAILLEYYKRVTNSSELENVTVQAVSASPQLIRKSLFPCMFVSDLLILDLAPDNLRISLSETETTPVRQVSLTTTKMQ